MSNTVYLQNGYRLASNYLAFRDMTLEEAKNLHRGMRVWFRANDGTARMVTINGQPKTWKRTPERVEVPVKYGLYEYSRFDEKNLRLLVLIDGRE
jgi:hypothetical protein